MVFRATLLPVVAGALALSCAGTARLGAPEPQPPAPLIEIRFAQPSPASGFVYMESIVSRQESMYVAERRIVADEHIERARPFAGRSPFSVAVLLSPDGAALLHEASLNHGGRQLAVLVESRLVGSARITGAITPSPSSRWVHIAVPVGDSAAREIAAKVAARWPE